MKRFVRETSQSS